MRDGRKARDLFDDEQYFEACKQLSRMAGEREITVLLAKLYADQMVATWENPEAGDLPKTIPDLMLRYLNELNRNVGGEDNVVVQRDAKVIAWECIKAAYRPGPAGRRSVILALNGNGGDQAAAETRLGYLIDRLRVVQVTGSAEQRIRFALDPLAEYLAALHVIDATQGRGNRQRWEAFFRKADAMEGAPKAISSFLLALRDCCLASDLVVPEHVPHELAKRGGFDEDTIQYVRNKQRIAKYIQLLGSHDSIDRLGAARTLGQIGPPAVEAVPNLIKALMDAVPEMRKWPLRALRMIGLKQKANILTVLAMLNDTRKDVRSAAAMAVALIGPEAKDAVPSLIEMLTDTDLILRSAAATALAKIGSEAEQAVPDLINALSDAEADVRCAAAEALAGVGPGANDAVTSLVKNLSDNEFRVRRESAEALGQLGPGASSAAHELARCLDDEEFSVRSAAAKAVGRIGPGAKDATEALVKSLSDTEASVRWEAAAHWDE